MHRDWAEAHLAGDVAERKFNGRHRFGGHSDLLHASDLLEYISTSVEQFDARLRVAYVGARDLIEDVVCQSKNVRLVGNTHARGQRCAFSAGRTADFS